MAPAPTKAMATTDRRLFTYPLTDSLLISNTWLSRLLPGLGGHIARHRQRSEVRDQGPDSLGPECAAECRHALWTTVVDRVEHLGIRATVAPATVCQVGSDPSAPITPVATVAIHRGKQQRTALGHRPVPLMRIAQGSAGRGNATGCKMRFVTNRRRRAGLLRGRRSVPAAGGHREARQQQRRRYASHVPRHRPKIQIMPPWLVWRAISLRKSAGGRTSAGSSERVSPDSSAQSPPKPAYTATYCLPSGPR